MSRYQFQGGWPSEPVVGEPQQPSNESDLARQHRRIVTQLIREGTKQPGGSVAVLGAGACRDLDLPQLVEHFSAVHLVDLDYKAMLDATREQRVAKHPHIKLHGDYDVTGVHLEIKRLEDQAHVNDAALERLIDRAARFRWSQLPSDLDVIASTCLLSQLVHTIVERFDINRPLVLQLIQTVRLRHLQLMIESLKPKGIGLLIFDFVSSETIPDLANYRGDQLRRVLSDAIHANNFFHGMNPTVINQILLHEPSLTNMLLRADAVHPWVWDAGTRHYAVTAVEFQLV